VKPIMIRPWAALEIILAVLDLITYAAWTGRHFLHDWRQFKKRHKMSIWKIEIPKERVIALLDKLDADQDGYISGKEIRAAIKDYLTAVRNSARFYRPKE